MPFDMLSIEKDTQDMAQQDGELQMHKVLA